MASTKKASFERFLSIHCWPCILSPDSHLNRQPIITGSLTTPERDTVALREAWTVLRVLATVEYMEEDFLSIRIFGSLSSCRLGGMTSLPTQGLVSLCFQSSSIRGWICDLKSQDSVPMYFVTPNQIRCCPRKVAVTLARQLSWDDLRDKGTCMQYAWGQTTWVLTIESYL